MASISTKVIETKPATFARGVPKEERNGFYGEGLADKLIGMPIGTKFTVIATFELDDVVTRRGKGTVYPVLSTVHLEPIWDEEREEAAKALQEEEYTERTGQNQLDFSSGTEGNS